MARLLLVGLLCLYLASAAKVPKKPVPAEYDVTTQEPQDVKITEGETQEPVEPVESAKVPQTPVHPTDMTIQEDINEEPEVEGKEPSVEEPQKEEPQKKMSSKPTHKVKPSVPKPLVSSAKGPSSIKVLNYASPVQFMQNAQPGIDFPNYSIDNMPQTSFDCDDYNYPGYYADVETKCQVFHYCPFKVEGQKTVGIAFLCPNYTVFDQKVLTCNWCYQVDCDQAPNQYDKINSRLYQTALPLIDDEPDVPSHIIHSETSHVNPSEVEQPPVKKPQKKPIKKSN